YTKGVLFPSLRSCAYLLLLSLLPLIILPPPISTLFPYTTLFRSARHTVCAHLAPSAAPCLPHSASAPSARTTSSFRRASPYPDRSEEHTSELQSHLNLVCRLLLEKKKT